MIDVDLNRCGESVNLLKGASPLKGEEEAPGS
jgi:hypothetical protein